MLEELRIRGLGVIDDALLPLGTGLSVVTGETGAGKTMVIGGLLLLFGGRAEAARIRGGASQAVVDGVLRVAPDGAVAARVADAGGSLDADGTLVLRRAVSTAGRSRAFVGGAPAPVAVLGELSERLLAVHGQSDQLQLRRPDRQRDILDGYAGIDLAGYRAAYRDWRELDATLSELTDRRAEHAREADLLAFGLTEIDALAPQAGELTELSAAAQRLGNAAELIEVARGAHAALVGDPADPGLDGADAGALIGGAHRRLAQLAGTDSALDALASRLAELGALGADLAAELASYADAVDADPAALQATQERIAALTALVRKYAPAAQHDLDGVLGWAEQARRRHAELDVSDERLDALRVRRDSVAATLRRAAATLTESRRDAAKRLADAVGAELNGLGMSGASLSPEVRVRASGRDIAEPGRPPYLVGGHGADEVAFVFRARPDAPALPLGRGPSGGELSRLMLALEVSLAGRDPVPTMVFDEVDAGIGGRAAIEVGRRLARLAADHQVLVVTHLPQVAAYADRHIVVDRPAEAAPSEQGSVVASGVRVVTGPARIAELARMLSGSDTPAARGHAEELLADAERDKRTPATPPASHAEASRTTRKRAKRSHPAR